jgi:hypothetical protein
MPPGNPNQVQVKFSPTPNGSVQMSVNAPDGAVDIELPLESAAGILVDLAKVVGQVAGVDVSSAFEGLEQELAGGQGGSGGMEAMAPEGGMPMGPGGPPGGMPMGPGGGGPLAASLGQEPPLV